MIDPAAKHCIGHSFCVHNCGLCGAVYPAGKTAYDTYPIRSKEPSQFLGNILSVGSHPARPDNTHQAHLIIGKFSYIVKYCRRIIDFFEQMGIFGFCTDTDFYFFRKNRFSKLFWVDPIS